MKANKTTFLLASHPGPMSLPGFQPRLQRPPYLASQGGRTGERNAPLLDISEAYPSPEDLPEFDSTTLPRFNDLWEVQSLSIISCVTFISSSSVNCSSKLMETEEGVGGRENL